MWGEKKRKKRKKEKKERKLVTKIEWRSGWNAKESEDVTLLLIFWPKYWSSLSTRVMTGIQLKRQSKLKVCLQLLRFSHLLEKIEKKRSLKQTHF